MTNYQIVDKTPEKLIFSGASKNQFFRNLCSCSTQVKNTKEYEKTLSSAYKRIEEYLSDYQRVFQNRTKKFFDKAKLCTQGFLVGRLRNNEIPLLPARDIREWLCFILSKEQTEQDMIQLIMVRHYRQKKI